MKGEKARQGVLRSPEFVNNVAIPQGLRLTDGPGSL
jgi:hypothetical protein